MKGVIISVCIAVGIVAGGIVYTNHMWKVSEELQEINDEIMECLDREDYDAAAENTEKLTEYLDGNRTVLAATGNHEELDKIEMNISEMSGYIDGRKQTDAVSRCKVLSFLFEHLPKNYEMKLENIL